MKRLLIALSVLLVLAGVAAATALRVDEPREEAVCRELRDARDGGTLSAAARAEVVRERERESQRGAAKRRPECGFLEEAALTEPMDAALSRQLFGSDTTPADGIRTARRQAAALQVAKTKDRSWEFDGITGTGGRVLDIALDPELTDTIYVASASGGVWRSDDAGRSFRPTWPDDLSPAIGAIAMTPDGVLYAGTGEAGPGGGSITYGGQGVFRSDDRGETWKKAGLETSSRIGRIVVDPANPKRIFVAAIGQLYKPGGQRGLYVTEDGGRTWQRTLRGDNETTGVADIQFDPNDPEVAYATTWQNAREPDRRAYTGVGSGMYKSTDGGRSFSRIGVPVFGPSPALGRIGVTVGPDSRVWAISTGESGLYQGTFVSSNGGTTWEPRLGTTHAALDGQFVYGWWFGRIWVDPGNKDAVYVAGVNMSKSTNGGQTWSVDARNHADHHALVWDPRVPGRVFNGNDGGVYVSQDAMATWDEQSKDQTWTQLYSFDVSAQDARKKVASLQDNGSLHSFEEGADWRAYHGGDGTRSLISPEDDTVYYGCSQYGACNGFVRGQRFSFGGDTSTNPVVSSRKNYSAPLEFQPGKPDVMYTGGEIMSRSTNQGRSWTPISPELSNGPGRETNPLFKNFGTLTTISPSTGGTTIYAGTDDGNLWANHAGGAIDGWVRATDADLPRAWVTRVEQDPADPMTAYATYSGFRSGDDAAYVVRTRDGGRTWDDISGDLPNAPVNDVNVLGDTLIVASDLGVFVTEDEGRTWERLGEDLPAAPVYDLKLAADGNLYAGTFGRGIFRIAQPG